MVLDLHTEVILILFLIISGISYIIYRKEERRIKFAIIVVFILYMLLLIKVTIFPIWIVGDDMIKHIYMEFGKYITFTQFVPFKTIGGIAKDNIFSIQIIGNILLLLPLPCFISIFKNNISAVKLIIIGALTSFSIELIQLLENVITRYPAHVCDIDDLILNTFGVIIGTGIMILIRKIWINRQ